MKPSRLAPSLVALAAFAACRSSSPDVPAVTPVVVTVSPAAVEVAAGAAVTFTATVTGATDTAVTWAVVEAGGGTIDGTGHYLAPGAAGLFHVRATSVADPAASDTADVTVTAPPLVTVTVAPATAAVDACLTAPFTATVTGSTNQAVTWSVREGAAGGSVSAGGLYTAPAGAGTYQVVATSAADPSRSGAATVTVTERVLSVQVSPAVVSVPPGGSAPVSATVTTTCGSSTSGALLTPEGTLVPR